MLQNLSHEIRSQDGFPASYLRPDLLLHRTHSLESGTGKDILDSMSTPIGRGKGRPQSVPGTTSNRNPSRTNETDDDDVGDCRHGGIENESQAYDIAIAALLKAKEDLSRNNASLVLEDSLGPHGYELSPRESNPMDHPSQFGSRKHNDIQDRRPAPGVVYAGVGEPSVRPASLNVASLWRDQVYTCGPGL